MNLKQIQIARNNPNLKPGFKVLRDANFDKIKLEFDKLKNDYPRSPKKI